MHKALLLAPLLLSTLALTAQSGANHATAPHPSAHQIIKFDAPGAVWTSPAGLNDAGQIAGSY